MIDHTDVAHGGETSVRCQYWRTLDKKTFRDGNGYIYWYQADPVGAGRARVNLVDWSLYSGKAGVLYLLAGLESRSPVEAQILAALLREFAERHSEGRSLVDQPIGFFSGTGGILFLAKVLVRRGLLPLDTYENIASNCIEAVIREIDNDRSFDVIMGGAGALLALHARGPGSHTSTRRERLAAKALLEKLFAEFRRTGHWSAWQPSGFNEPVSGLAHGPAGIALAAGRVGQSSWSRDDSLRRIAKNVMDVAIRAQSECFVEDSGRFLSDLKSSDIKGGDPHSWCYGHDGVAIAVSDQSKAWGISKAALDKVVSNCLEPRTIRDLCLCHGIAGQIVTSGLIAETFQIEPSRSSLFSDWEDVLIEELLTEPSWNLMREDHGLMTGLAGIVLTLSWPLGARGVLDMRNVA